MRKVLTIAGSDPSGGAGIQADLKTFSAFGVYGMTVVTAVTAQNSAGVQRILDLPPDLVAVQLESVLGDIGADAAKTGMLATRAIIQVVGEKLEQYGVRNLVMDPVMVAGTADSLMSEEDRHCLTDLLPLAKLVTPNLEEAEVLSGLEVNTVADMRKAAEAIHRLGPGAVLVKGGHLEGDPVDVLYDGRKFTEFSGERLAGEVHGTGCAFSAAIASGLARQEDVQDAIRRAKSYIGEAIKMSLSIGRGRPSVNYLVWV